MVMDVVLIYAYMGLACSFPVMSLDKHCTVLNSGRSGYTVCVYMELD